MKQLFMVLVLLGSLVLNARAQTYFPDWVINWSHREGKTICKRIDKLSDSLDAIQCKINCATKYWRENHWNDTSLDNYYKTFHPLALEWDSAYLIYCAEWNKIPEAVHEYWNGLAAPYGYTPEKQCCACIPKKKK